MLRCLHYGFDISRHGTIIQDFLESGLGIVMKLIELERMSTDDLWGLHVEIGEALAVRLATEKDLLEERLMQLSVKPPLERRRVTSERRQYPPVVPKFRNPDEPSETWAGRGKQPRWLAEQIKSGRQIDDFKIRMAAE
jgi:DNA-binding protein H-NS